MTVRRSRWATASGWSRPTSTRPSPTTSACTSSMATMCSRAGPSTSEVGEPLGQRPEGAAAMGDGLLLGQRHLRERAAVAAVGDEQRVVAEALVASGVDGDVAVDGALGGHLAAVREA